MAEHLDAARVDQVQVADLVGGRGRVARDQALAARKAGEPAELQASRLSSYSCWMVSGVCSMASAEVAAAACRPELTQACRLGCQSTMRSCTERRIRIGGQSRAERLRRKTFRRFPTGFPGAAGSHGPGISRKNSSLTGWPSGDSNGIGSRRRTNAASGAFRLFCP